MQMFADHVQLMASMGPDLKDRMYEKRNTGCLNWKAY